MRAADTCDDEGLFGTPAADVGGLCATIATPIFAQRQVLCTLRITHICLTTTATTHYLDQKCLGDGIL